MSRRQHHKTRQRSRVPRRGSVLILVVSVLVLLAITATVYVGVGRMDRQSAAAEELKTHREAVSAKIFDYIGQILVLDLYGNRTDAPYPFYDDLAPFGYGPLFGDGYPQQSPERWDFPYTRPGNADLFNVQADPWLADIQPVDTDGDGLWDHWRHISNIHPQGRFVDIGGFFTGNGDRFYNNLYIGGGNTDPYDLDTFTNFNGADPFVYTRQMSRQNTNDISSDDVVSWADRRLGADTDGDGRIDARWTELLDVYGLPKEMRFFVSTRIIDASGLLNINANWEFGAKNAGDSSNQVGWGQTPADVDLYTYLYDAYVNWGGVQRDAQFIDGSGTQNQYGYKDHIIRTGLQAAFMPGSIYSAVNRSTRVQRRTMWNRAARNPYRSTDGLHLYGPADEIELRANMFIPNEIATSTLEANFDGLNFDPADPATWHNPLRSRSYTRRETSNPDWIETLDYAAGTPTLIGLSRDARHALTTFNGSRPVRPWNLGWTAGDTIGNALDPNALIRQADSDTAALQSLVGGFMWSLAPFAIDRGDSDGSDIGQSVYGTGVFWQPTSLNQQYHFGGADAGYAMYKSAQLAMNAIDATDDDSEPKARTLRMARDYTDPNREPFEIIGRFDFGRIPASLASAHGDQADSTVTIFGLEPQPFIREVTAVNVYRNSNNDPQWDYIDGPQDEWAAAILAVELGNPFAEAIDLGEYEIKYGDNLTMDLAIGAPPTLGPGETVVVYAAFGRPDDLEGEGIPRWESIIDGRAAPNGIGVYRIGGNVEFNFEDATGDGYDKVTIWRKNFEYGNTQRNQMLVDRLEPFPHNSDEFPNIITGEGEPIPIGRRRPTDTEYTVRVGSMRRYSGDSAAGAGFPGYVLQSPAIIGADGRVSSEADDQDYFSPGLANPAIPTGLVAWGLSAAPDYLNDSDDNKGYSIPPEFAPFQLVVPNLEANGPDEDRQFRSAADLLLLASVGNLHLEQVTTNDPIFTNPDYYVTVSEQLGDEDLYRRLQGRGIPDVVLDIIRPADQLSSTYPPDFRIDSTGAANRFVGKLDFTRYIPSGNQVALPYEAIPVACRILDAFDTLSSVDAKVPLVQGRININTAPQRVLEALPYLDPRFAIGPIPARDQGNGLFMARALRAYRDGLAVDPNNGNTLDWTLGPRYEVSNLKVGNNSGLRDDAGSRFVGANELKPGFTSLGELLLATRWTPSGQSNQPDPTVLLDESPYRTGYDTQNTVYPALAPDPKATIPPVDRFDPADDPGEQIALIRAIRNSVSIRSDVYIAYITLVGFTPGDIREAEQGGTNISERLARLHASMEQRYMVVFDRSNVKLPTDRPRVLFAVQEVPTR